ncbi:MAG TPA: WG repeat-containing protein [Pseudosphingobacterium sp.]|nr:WG repeat-containing protein [Pseudosphingobacterium sp.]
MKKECTILIAVLLCSWGFAQAQLGIVQADEGYAYKNLITSFNQGYARVIQDGKQYYINTKGERSFDMLDPQSAIRLGDVYNIQDYKAEKDKNEGLPKSVIRFVKDGKWGVMAPDGTVLLQALYDEIDISNIDYWKLTKGKEQSFYLNGENILPFFEDIGYLDGNHFDVKQKGSWGLYSLREQKLILQPQYEAFDYCGGCGLKPSYLYAKRNGKWGIISWEGKELLPFEYEHEHVGMRSDNWVQSFSKNGKKLIVHIPTRREFVLDEESAYPKVVSGLLIFKESSEEGLTVGYGIYGEDGQQVLPAQYERIEEPNENSYLGYDGDYLLVQQAGKTGVINKSGQIIIPPQYEEVAVYDDYFVTKEGNQSILFNKEHSALLKLENVEISHVNDYFYSSGSNGLEIFKIKEKAYYGLFFAEEEKYYPPEFYEVEADSRSESKIHDLIVAKKQGIITLFDLQGNLLLPPLYDQYVFLKELPYPLVQVGKDEKIGVYNIQLQKEVIPIEYDTYVEIIGSHQQYVICRKGSYDAPEYDLRDLQGNKVMEQSFSTKDSISGTYYLFGHKEGNAFTLFDTENQHKQTLLYPHIWQTGSSRLLLVSSDGVTGQLFDMYKGIVLKKVVDVRQFSMRGDAPQVSEHPVLFPFRNGFARILKDGKYGFIDEEGKELGVSSYGLASDFQAMGIALVATSDNGFSGETQVQKIDFINKQGKSILDGYVAPNYNYWEFSDMFIGNNILLFKEDGKTGTVNTGLADASGKILLQPEYSTILLINDEKFLLLEKDKQFGVADLKGRILIPVQFDNIGLKNLNFNTYHDPADIFPVPVSSNGKWFYIDKKGKRLPIEADNFEI